jgi:two-component system LytT family response regulator
VLRAFPPLTIFEMTPVALKCLIVDDERNNRIIMQSMLQKYVREVKDIREASSISEAIDMISLQAPDIVLLDVQMQEENGFNLLQQITDPGFQVIFVTAHERYALKAFRFDAVDYLLKPIVADELKRAIEKAVLRMNSNGNNVHQNSMSNLQEGRHDLPHLLNISIATTDGFCVMPIDKIVYCEAKSNYTIFHVVDRSKVISSHNLGYYAELLKNDNFFRAHRSYLLNLLHVRSYKKGEAGFITMSNNDEVELSRNNKNDFLQLFKG